MWVVNYRKIFYTISGIIVLASVASFVVFGFKPGIDFTGGTLIEVSYSQRPEQTTLTQALTAIDPTVSVRASGSTEYIVRMKPISQTEKVGVMAILAPQASSTDATSTATTTTQATVKTFDSIGPVLGAEALRKSMVSIVLVLLGIVLFITFAFRKVSEPVSSWKYGLIAIVGLIHNVLIPAGVFSILGHYLGYEVDTLFVTALLVILGFSVHDTIVVFDRVRENLKHTGTHKPFAEVVGHSISQTFTRSINTSLTTLIALVVLYIFGGSSTEHFSLALIIGIAVGTYCSIFICSPLLVTIEKWGSKK